LDVLHDIGVVLGRDLPEEARGHVSDVLVAERKSSSCSVNPRM